MSDPKTVSIDPVAALNAIAEENEWRRNRILMLENDKLKLSRTVEAQQEELTRLAAAAVPASQKKGEN